MSSGPSKNYYTNTFSKFVRSDFHIFPKYRWYSYHETDLPTQIHLPSNPILGTTTVEEQLYNMMSYIKKNQKYLRSLLKIIYNNEEKNAMIIALLDNVDWNVPKEV